MFIVCDWGSSRLRAWLVDETGKISGRYESENGVKAMAGRDRAFRDELGTVISGFGVGEEVPVRISGMAGAKGGWVDTEYVSTPAGSDGFSGNSVPVSGFSDVRVYGGLMHTRSDGSVDVMRGEEIQVFGLLARHPEASLICLPGTHSKWVRVEDGKITGFNTYMTGDLFHSLCENSIFRGQINGTEFHREGFLHGFRLAAEGKGLNDLFTLRTEYVFSKIPAEGFHSCLSGFLIANEIRAEAFSGTPFLCGSEELAGTYGLALAEAGIKSVTADSEAATIRGHLAMITS